MKILAIGNSFSDDALYYYSKIANSMGVKNVIVGIVYMAGARLSQHWENIINKSNSYVYRKDTSGIFIHKENASMIDALLDEKWDIITFQQSSGYSGINESYEPYLTDLITYVKRNSHNNEVKFLWHQTWAFQSNHTGPSFAWYNNNQDVMYNKIIDAVKINILNNEKFTDIIPAGTAIQNARTSSLGDTLTQDGYHLSLLHGRYIAALTWFIKLNKMKLNKNIFIPEGISNKDFDIIKEACIKAVSKPFEISLIKSKFV